PSQQEAARLEAFSSSSREEALRAASTRSTTSAYSSNLAQQAAIQPFSPSAAACS
ncbi:hypothetical protein Dimus_007746, partial [Dionaea muscipula]